LTDGGKCDHHRREYERRRGSASARGYGRRWRKARAAFLREHPICEIYCKDKNLVTASTVVDHIQPHRGDLDLFWDQSNWQAGCKPCHDSKTSLEDGGFGRTTKG
jgi:5-methylcytosine-specific restriction protein A